MTQHVATLSLFKLHGAQLRQKTNCFVRKKTLGTNSETLKVGLVVSVSDQPSGTVIMFLLQPSNGYNKNPDISSKVRKETHFLVLKRLIASMIS